MEPHVHLSPVTWLIHISSVTEYLVAWWLLYKLARVSERADLTVLGHCMVLNHAGAFGILAYHASDNTAETVVLVARVLLGLGSVSMCYGATRMLIRGDGGRRVASILFGLAGLGALGWAMPQILGGDPEAANRAAKLVFIAGNSCYTVFVIELILLERREHALGWMTVGGFWFMFVFVGVSAVATKHVTDTLGMPTLSHHDFWHGAAESLLCVTNLIIALGLKRAIDRVGEDGAPAAPAAMAA